ncbi:MAG: phosphoglucomutase/phosphomannomutase family protein [Candidatus Margulisiibacteriota bacterium]
MIKFGTDGWRAIISEDFTFENVRIVAAAIAKYLVDHKFEKKPLIIGFDPRFLADKFAQEIARVMADAGISSFIVEYDTPTPVVAWEVKDKEACGAVMLTASHNPPEYCGIKFIPDYAGPANAGITREIEENLGVGVSRALGGGKGTIESFDPKHRYFPYITKFIDPDKIKKARPKVVIDAMHGAGRGYLDELLQKLGCTTRELNGERDVLFGGHNPEPSDELLGELKKKVVAEGADMGVAMDGDADRFGLVDEKGKFYSPNQVITMVFKYLVETRKFKGSVVRSIGTTHMIDAIAAKHKIKLHETPVGFKYIAEIMMKEPVIIGGEESGGFSIKGHIPEKDGLLANLLLVEMFSSLGKPISKIWEDIVAEIGQYYQFAQKIKLPEEKKLSLIKDLQAKKELIVAGIKTSGTRSDDGAKFYFGDGSWLLVRPSGTEPLVRVYVESKDKKMLDKIVEFVKSLI